MGREIWNTDQDNQNLITALAELDTGVGNKQVGPLINYYDPISIKTVYETRTLVSQLKCAENHNAYRIHHNLKSKLVHRRYLGAQEPTKLSTSRHQKQGG